MRLDQAGTSDDELVARSRSGDREAFAALYERHFAGLFDFAARIVRDRDAAVDIVQTTFTKAWTGLEGTANVRNVRAWLYTIARNAAIDELRHRGREVVAHGDDEDGPAFADLPAGPRSDPVTLTQDRELSELVWTSAAALGPQEYSLLDLHVRRDLGPDELAEALGLSKGAVYTRLSRLRDAVEESVTSTLLLRRGRRECPELDRLLTEMGATELTRPVHRAIRSHRRDCAICEESKRRFVSPMAILAGLAPIPAAAGVSEEVWRRVASTFDAPTGTSPGAGRAWRRIGGASRRSRWVAAVAAAAVVGASAAVLALSATPPAIEDPGDVRSTTHEIGTPSREREVEVVWSSVQDATGYSVLWSEEADDLPDADADLPGSATATASEELEDGSWYFHLRTRGRGDEWTSTVHVGPFVIEPAGGQDPAPPEILVDDVVVQEPASGMTTASLLVSLSAPAAAPVTVGYAFVGGRAEIGADYRAAPGIVSIGPGETSGLIELVVRSDDADEPDETIVVELSDPTNATLADPRVVVTIVARAVRPVVSVSDTSVPEGDSPGAAEAVFELVLSSSSEHRISVRWETRDGTASAGTDYEASSGTLRLAPGETSAHLRVPILGDTLEEPAESFSVRLTDATGRVRIPEAIASGTIRDDDEPEEPGTPLVSIEDGSVAEGDGGTSTIAFVVTLSEPGEDAVSVRYAIEGDSAGVGSDVRPGSGTLRFEPGETSGRVVATVVGDTVDEPDERFLVTLSAPQNAGLRDGRGVGTIRDDDEAPRVSIDDAVVEEGGNAALTLRLSNAGARRITVRVATTPGTAADGEDFSPASRTVAFAPGETTAEITVSTIEDAVDEADETVFVELSQPSGAAVGDGRAVVTIRDDDPAPSISIDDVGVSEGTGGSTTVTLSVTLSSASANTVRADYATAPGSAATRQDFLPASGTLTFAAGVTSATVAVTVVGDTVIEPTETFDVVLSNPRGATIGDGRGQVTIRDDDGSAPRIAAPSFGVAGRRA